MRTFGTRLWMRTDNTARASMISFVLAQLSRKDPINENHIAENDRQHHQRAHQHEDMGCGRRGRLRQADPGPARGADPVELWERVQAASPRNQSAGSTTFADSPIRPLRPAGDARRLHGSMRTSCPTQCLGQQNICFGPVSSPALTDRLRTAVQQLSSSRGYPCFQLPI
jgi:hypothetical protein